MECYSCKEIQRNTLAIRDTDGIPSFTTCCEAIPDIPQVLLEETPEETLRKCIDMLKRVDEECREIYKDDSKRHVTKGCANCCHFQYGPYENDGFIHCVILTVYPAPCQCGCIYCRYIKKDQSINTNTEEARKLYDHVFAVWELALEQGVIADDAVWVVGTGEISIHPHHDRIMKLIKGRNAIFYTNCIKFDEDIAQNLHDNPNSSIVFSIDAGTRETWRKVKGLDNFDKVMENLSKYHAKAARSEQITLKYIVLPGINDTYEDFNSCADIMKSLDVNKLTISRDLDAYDRYNLSEQDAETLTDSASHLLAVLTKNGFKAGLYHYIPEERKIINDKANELLTKGLI